MKTALTSGVIILVLSAVGIIACIVLVLSTNGRVSSDEALLVAVPLAVLFAVSLALTAFAANQLYRRN